ncbi:MAG: hypothetical protein CMM46_00580 [Rhodospirillaceae bacterium]|nr:hypothetical protein [Rhodospirillaceae bacterium]|tara:strand:+ start:13642 stop:14148 length:507 start_codon:yes stop_codon:yes gene_type:complete
MPCCTTSRATTLARQLLVEHGLAAAKARETEEAEIKRLQRRAKRLATWGKLWDNEKFSRRAKSIEKKKATVTYVAPEGRRNLKLADGGAQANILLRCNAFDVAEPNGDHLFTIERLEDEILNRDLTCVMVSRDRRFLDDVANRVFMIERGKLIEIDSADPFYDSLLED